MIGVLGEHNSDANTIAAIIRRIIGAGQKIRKKGFNGCNDLCRKGARVISTLRDQGTKRFVICHDADGPDPAPARQRILDRVVKPAEATPDSCIVVPVQEIEAWLIADSNAIAQVIPTFRLKLVRAPETINDPKEWLEKESRAANSKPLYIHQVHNERVAEHLNLDLLAMKCPSFLPLREFFGGTSGGMLP